MDYLGQRVCSDHLACRFGSLLVVCSKFWHFQHKTYGSLGAIIGFMMWMWLSIIVILVGAKLNAEIEHQTARETTAGRPKPLGWRGAKMADTIGAARR